jgi:hypothetical protein
MSVVMRACKHISYVSRQAEMDAHGAARMLPSSLFRQSQRNLAFAKLGDIVRTATIFRAANEV